MDTELENLLKELEKVKKERDAALELAENRNLFISSISHEIRSPVNAILGMINIYLEEIDFQILNRQHKIAGFKITIEYEKQKRSTWISA